MSYTILQQMPLHMAAMTGKLDIVKAISEIIDTAQLDAKNNKATTNLRK